MRKYFLAIILALAFSSSILAQNMGTVPIGAASGTATFTVGTAASFSVDITGTWVATLEFQGRAGGTWHTLSVLRQSDGTRVTSTSANGLFIAQNAGYSSVRVIATAFTSGSATVSATRGYGAVTNSIFAGTVSGASGAEFAEDSAHSNGALGRLTLGVRNDAGTALSTNGNYMPLTFDSSGNLRVTSSGGGGGAAQVDNTILGSLTGAGGLYDTTPPAITDGNIGAFRMDSSRYLYTVFPSAQAITVASLPLPTGAATESSVSRLTSSAEGIAPGTVGATTSFMVGGIYNSTPPTFTNGQRGALQLGSNGALQVGGSVSCSNCSGSGASSVDNSAFTFGTTSGAGSMFVVDETSPNAVTENSVGLARMTASRIMKVNLTDATGTALSIGNDYTDGTVYAAASAGPLGMAVRKDSAGAFTGVIDGDITPLQTTSNGSLRTAIDGTVTVGSHAVTNAGTFATQESGAALTALQLLDNVETGSTPAPVVSAATTNATSVKANAGRLLGIHVLNTTATLQYIRFYDLAAAPTCSSATGHAFSMPIPASTSGAGIDMNFGPSGIAFTTGIAYCITGGPTSTDNTAAIVGSYGVLTYK